MSSFRTELIRLAHTRPTLRPHLLPLLTRVGREFSTDDALKSYLKDHPDADPKNHWVKGKGESDKKDEGKDDKSDKKDEGKDKPKSEGEGKAKVKVTIDEKELEKRRPKVESEDLAEYAPDAEADDLSPEHREEIKDYKLSIVGKDARQAVEIARKIKEGIKKGSDICKMSPAVCEGNMGLTRDKMPQIEGEKTVKGLLASDDELDRKKGKAMVQAGADPDSDKTVLQHMIDHLAENGIKTSDTEIPVGMLKATQSEIKADKAFKMADGHLKGKFDKIDDSVVVSKDGHILDGHHRWAALLTIDPSRKMKVKVIDMNMKDLLAESQAVPGVYKADFEGNPLGEDDQKKYKSEAKSKFKGKSKKEAALRAGLIRLAHAEPAYRQTILALLAEAS